MSAHSDAWLAERTPRSFAALVAFVSALAVGLRVGLVLGAPAERVAALVLFVLAACLFGVRRSAPRALLAFTIAVLALAAARLLGGVEGNVILVTGGAASTALWVDPRRSGSRLGSILLAWTVLFGVRSLAAAAWDPWWRFEQQLSAGYCELVQACTRVPLRWGASASGLSLSVLGVCLLASAWAHGRVTAGRAGLALVLLGPLPLAVGWSAAELFGNSSAPLASPPAARVFAFQLLFLPWVAAVAALLLTRRRNGQVETAAARAPLAAVALGCCVPLATRLVPSGPEPLDASPGRVLFHARTAGLSDFRSPDWTRYGYGSTGLYGELARWLDSTGRPNAVVDRRLEAADLEGVRTLVLLVPTEPLDEGEVAAIREFVERGGGLLYLTDHTDLMGGAAIGNELLEPYGIEIRFDTAMETADTFAGNLQFRSAGWLEAPADAISAQILHGASLRISRGARPVVVGQAMFGDYGDRGNPGAGAYLGDYRVYPAVEQVGDLVLAASATPGAGRVVVFGDTSPFQNVAFARSLHMVEGIFEWLEGSGANGRRSGYLAALVASILLAAGAGLPPQWRSATPWLAAGTLVGALLVTTPPRGMGDNARASESWSQGRPLLLVHSGELPLWDVRHFEDRSIQGLATCASRAGLLPLVGDAARADLTRCAVVVVPPTGHLGEGLVERLCCYADQGGTLVVASGYEERLGVEPLLARVGLALEDVPLGAAPILRYDEQADYRGPQFAEAWPVASTRGAIQPAEVVFSIDERPIVVERRTARGRVVVIGDSWFLCDRNLEGEQAYQPGNLGFVRHLLFERDMATEARR